MQHHVFTPIFVHSGRGGSDSQGRTSVGIVYNALPGADVMGGCTMLFQEHCVYNVCVRCSSRSVYNVFVQCSSKCVCTMLFQELMLWVGVF